MIEIRKATLNDCKMIFDWRNHPTIRKISLNSDELNYDDHVKWFEKVVISNRQLLLVASLNNTPCGVVRFDCEKSTAQISIYLSPDFIGKGIGTSVLAKSETWLKLNQPEINSIKAQVLPDNLPSKKMFEKQNYKLTHLEYIKII
ncbi:MAG: GNAT family N-acetyltransferase [Bacteriovoracaceae bacterium]